MNKFSQQFILQTQSEWEDHYPQTLTEDEACEIISSLTHFFEVLRKWEISEEPDDKKGEQGQ